MAILILLTYMRIIRIRRQCIIRIDEYGFTYISMNMCVNIDRF